MPIIRWEPFQDINRFFEDFPMRAFPKFGEDLAADVYEEKGNVVVEFSISGFDPDKFDISVEDNYLRVTGTREEEKETKEKTYYSKEIRRGSFERVVRLPSAVNGDKATASYKDGVLKVVIPKREESKARKIKVKSEKK